MSNGLWIVVGSAVGAGGAILAGAVDRTVKGRSELVQAAAAWMAATHAFTLMAKMDTTYSVEPANRVGQWLEAGVSVIEETLGEGRVELLRSLVFRRMLERMESVADRVWETTSRLVLVAPAPLLREIQPHLDTLSEWIECRSDAELQRKWESEGLPAVVRALRRWTQPRWRRRGRRSFRL